MQGHKPDKKPSERLLACAAVLACAAAAALIVLPFVLARKNEDKSKPESITQSDGLDDKREDGMNHGNVSNTVASKPVPSGGPKNFDAENVGGLSSDSSHLSNSETSKEGEWVFIPSRMMPLLEHLEYDLLDHSEHDSVNGHKSTLLRWTPR